MQEKTKPFPLAKIGALAELGKSRWWRAALLDLPCVVLTAAPNEAIESLPGVDVTGRLAPAQQMLSQGVGGIFPPQERFQ